MSPLLETRGSGSASAYGFTSSSGAARLESGIVTSGLVLSLDAKYPGTSKLTEWQDGSGNGRNFTFENTPTYSTNNSGIYSLNGSTGFARAGVITNSTSCTMQFWMKTSDDQALFWSGSELSSIGGGYFVSAYSAAQQQYSSPMTNPSAFINLSQTTTLRSSITSSNVWRLIEFKGINFSDWPNNKFNQYDSFDFDSVEVGAIFMYNRDLTAGESTQNFNALRGRYGL